MGNGEFNLMKTNSKSKLGATTARRIYLVIALVLSQLFASEKTFAQNCTPPPPNMVSWWGGDGNPNDIQGTNNGTFLAGTYAPGEVAHAFHFDGVDDAVRITDNPSLRLSQFTVDMWVRLDAPSLVTKDIITKGVVGPITSEDPGKNFNYAIFLLANGTVDAGFEDQDGTNHFASSISQLATGVFYHIAVTYDGTAVQLYVNGVLEGVHVTSATPDLSSVDVMIGNSVKDPGHNPSDVWQGLIDEVEIFNRALSPGEVEAIYNAGSAGKCKPCTPPPPNMAAWWPAEGNADNIHNITNSGTLQGGVTFAPGKVGQAFTFDGTGAVNIPNQGTEGELNFQGSDFTLNTWVRFTGTLVPGEAAAIFQNYSGLSLYELYIDGNNRANFLFRDFDGNIVDVSGTTTLNDGLWHHVVGVRANKTGRVYVDGVEENNATNPLVGGVQIICYYARIGGGNSGADNCYEGFADQYFFTGQIDDVALFRRALTAGEVQAIYAAGSSGMCGSTPTPTPTPTATPNSYATLQLRPPLRQQQQPRLPRQLRPLYANSYSHSYPDSYGHLYANSDSHGNTNTDANTNTYPNACLQRADPATD